jgi:hypothetical protein
MHDTLCILQQNPPHTLRFTLKSQEVAVELSGRESAADAARVSDLAYIHTYGKIGLEKKDKRHVLELSAKSKEGMSLKLTHFPRSWRIKVRG